MLGVYYFKQKSNDIATVELNPPPPGVQRDSDNNKVDNKSWAVFTQWTLNLVDDRLGLTAGARYTEDDKGSYPDQFDYATPNIKQVPVQWYRATFSAFTPSASVSYKLTDTAMIYTSYSEGFKGGGWNSHFNSGAHTGATGSAAEVQAGRSEDHGARLQTRSRRTHGAPERRGVHV